MWWLWFKAVNCASRAKRNLLYCPRVLCFFVPLFDEGKCEETMESPLVLWTFQTQRLLRCLFWSKAMLVHGGHDDHMVEVIWRWMIHCFLFLVPCVQTGAALWQWVVPANRTILLTLTLTLLTAPPPSGGSRIPLLDQHQTTTRGHEHASRCGSVELSL